MKQHTVGKFILKVSFYKIATDKTQLFVYLTQKIGWLDGVSEFYLLL